MKMTITAAVFALYTIGVTAVYAAGCNHHCADGYTYDKEAGACVKESISS